MGKTAENSAKEAMLGAIRARLAESAPFDAARGEHPARADRETGEPVEARVETIDPIAVFRDNLAAVGGDCEIVESRAEALEVVRDIVRRVGARRLAVSDAELPREFTAAFGDGLEIVDAASKQALFETDLGLTGAQYGIAETGTLVLESDREFHRLTSLVPPVHVCLLEADKIRWTLGEVLEILEQDLSKTITFITGPSRTSDIELTLAIGVHGPAALYVVIVDEP